LSPYKAQLHEINMRPYTENAKTPKDGGKKRRGKAKEVVGGVKKSIVKAKVTAVKAGKKKLNKAEKEEVDNLLEISRNEAATNGNGCVETPKVKVAATSSKVSVAALNKKMEKIKSAVSIAANRNGNFEPMDSTPTRRSKRISQRTGDFQNGDHVNGHENGHSVNGKEESNNDVSVAEEATESSVNGAGLLKKTISKIWKLPQDIASGVSYQEINGTTTPSKATTNGSSNSETDAPNKSSCVIS